MRADGYQEAVELGFWLLGASHLLGRRDSAAPPLGPRWPFVFAEGRECAVVDDSGDWEALSRRLDGDSSELQSWSGDFTFAHMGPTGVLTVARSVSGRAPVYVLSDRGRTVVATQLGTVVRYSSRMLELDPWPVALHIETLMPDAVQSVVAGVLALPPGHLARSDQDFAPVRYWDPRRIATRPASRRGQAEHSERLRDAVFSAVAAETDDATLLTLSGGFDSSCLAVVAHQLGKTYSTLTFLPPVASDQARERLWLGRVRDYVRPSISRQWELELSARRRLSLLESAPQTVVPFRHPALAMLPSLRAEGAITTLMGGEGADELFGSITVHEDWMTTLRPSDLVRLPEAIPFMARFAKRYARHLLGWALEAPPLPLPRQMSTLFRHVLRQRYVQWRRQLAASIAGSPAARPFLELRYRSLANGMAAHWEACSKFGVARSFPFVSRELIELAFETHPAEELGWGGKRLSRIGFRSVVPPRIRARRDKGVSSYGELPSVLWTDPTPPELGGVVRGGLEAGAAEVMGIWEALRLRALLNIVGALRTERHCHEHS